MAIAYAVTTWVLLQLTDTVSDILQLPEWAPKLILLMLVIGFVPALILAWAFELTPSGVKLEREVKRSESITPKTGRKLDYIIIISLGLSLGYFIWESRFEQKTAEIAANPPSVSIAEPAAEAPVAPIGTPLSDVDKNSIAVLPFANRSADAEDIYFTDGIHDDLLTQLSKIDAFSVISRTSVMEYRDTSKNLRQIARELSVANVMEGSVQRAGDRVRINVQLIDAETDEHLWAEIYDRELTTSNLFDIQSEIARSIADALKATLTDSELASVADVPTDNVEAYDQYLFAKRLIQSETRTDNKTAIELFKEVLSLDPEFKLAWIELAKAYMTKYWQYGGDPADRELAWETIGKAKGIDANFAELYMAEAFYWYWGYLDYERALYNIKKCIEMMPGNEEAYMWQGWIARRAGFWEEAAQSMQKSLKLNPRTHFNWAEYSITAAYMHDYEEAKRAAQQARTLDPESFWGRTTLARVVLQESGDTQTALQLSVGAQHSHDYFFFQTYMRANLFNRNFDEALEAARNLPVELEIQRGEILFKEDWAAQILHYMEREEEAVLAANAALFRLKGLRTELGEDYRIDRAEARISAVQGATADKIRALVKKSMDSMPQDDLAASAFKLDYARIFAIKGLAGEAVEILESILLPPGETSVYTLNLDPAFDGIRDNPEFVAMIERHK